MKKKSIKNLIITTVILALFILIIAFAIIAIKVMLCKPYSHPVPISPFMSYGQRIDEHGKHIAYIPYESDTYEVILP